MLCYMGLATMENRHGLAVAGMVTYANGTAERRASETMLKAKSKVAGHRITAGEDKAYGYCRSCVTWHRMWRRTRPSPEPARPAAVPSTTMRHPGYGMSQSRRAMIECIFGWQHGTMRKTKHRGIGRVAANFLLNLIAYNLVPIPKLVSA
jgi:hypothetical protein